MMRSEPQSVFRPRLRDDIRLGPAQHAGGTTVYYLKDTFTRWFYRIGAREYFLISRMDGSRSLQELSNAYASEFGRPLNERSWESLFTLLEKRQMLTDTADSAKLEELKEVFAERKRQENRGLFRRRFPIVKPDAFLERLLPWVQFMFHRAFVIPALVCIALLEVLVLTHLHDLVADVWTVRSAIWEYLLFLVLVWTFTIFHEIAHGLTCKKFGGSVSEMGLLWRYLSIFPYCKIDDIMLFHNRWHRVYASFAGIFVNFLSVIPFSILWALTPTHNPLHVVSALMLISFNLMTFMNFIPFIELDGYFMLNHALNMADLRKEAHQFWKRGFLKRVLRHGNGNAGFSRRDTAIYLVYGFFSLTITGAFLVFMAVSWFFLIKYWLGSIVSWGVLLLIAFLLLYRELGKRKAVFMPGLMQRLLRI